VDGLLTNACTPSIRKSFKTPGSPPRIFVDQVPHCRLISARVVSIEWLKPLAVNGDTLEYQLIRLDTGANRTQTVYIGSDTYYLDIDATFKPDIGYAYMVIYSNEFGDSFSNWSAEIRTGLDVDSELQQPIIRNEVDGTRSVFILCSLRVRCASATGSSVQWRPYVTSELVNYLAKLVEFNAEFRDVEPLEAVVNAENLRTGQLTRTRVDAGEGNRTEVRHLVEGSRYAFQLNYFLRFSLVNRETNETRHEVFKFFSETVECSTLSLKDVFGKFFFKFVKLNVYTILIEFILLDMK